MTDALQRPATASGVPTRRMSVSTAVALQAIVVLAIVVVLTELLARRLEVHAGGGPQELTWWDVALGIVEHVLFVAAVLVPTWLLLGRVRASDLDLRPVPWRSAIGSAAVIYAGYMLIATLLFVALGTPPVRESARALAHADSVSLLIASTLIACVLAPPTEELLFRGLLFSALRHRLGSLAAAVAAGALFGAVHGPPLGAMLDLALLGTALCLLYDRTGSLLPCIAVHALHNVIAFGGTVSLSPPATIALALAAPLVVVAITCALMPGAREPDATSQNRRS